MPSKPRNDFDLPIVETSFDAKANFSRIRDINPSNRLTSSRTRIGVSLLHLDKFLTFDLRGTDTDERGK